MKNSYRLGLNFKQKIIEIFLSVEDLRLEVKIKR